MLSLVDDALGQFRELLDVLLPLEWTGAQRMCIGNDEFVDYRVATRQSDRGPNTERLLLGANRVVAVSPIGILDRGDPTP